mmetsp:Transcript_24719/g.38490  ORF Transcript_24719/g.38490 Transcript_24719/m.38490 type:complete len:342 (-) Transcript_24719:447-1472(-)
MKLDGWPSLNSCILLLLGRRRPRAVVVLEGQLGVGPRVAQGYTHHLASYLQHRLAFYHVPIFHRRFPVHPWLLGSYRRVFHPGTGVCYVGRGVAFQGSDDFLLERRRRYLCVQDDWLPRELLGAFDREDCFGAVLVCFGLDNLVLVTQELSVGLGYFIVQEDALGIFNVEFIQEADALLRKTGGGVLIWDKNLLLVEVPFLLDEGLALGLLHSFRFCGLRLLAKIWATAGHLGQLVGRIIIPNLLQQFMNFITLLLELTPVTLELEHAVVGGQAEVAAFSNSHRLPLNNLRRVDLANLRPYSAQLFRLRRVLCSERMVDVAVHFPVGLHSARRFRSEVCLD